MQSRGAVQFKIHIDHIDNAGGEVWALQYGTRYFVLKRIHVSVPLVTVFAGRTAPQPRAYLTGHGTIVINGKTGYIS